MAKSSDKKATGKVIPTGKKGGGKGGKNTPTKGAPKQTRGKNR